MACSVELVLGLRQVEHGVLWLARNVLLDLKKVRQVKLGGGDAGVGLKQHEAGVGAGVDVQLVILVPPREAATSLLYRDITIPVSLDENS